MRRFILFALLVVPQALSSQTRKPVPAPARATLRIPDAPHPPLDPPATRVEYDEFNRSTVVTMGDRVVAGDLGFSGLFSYAGKTPRVPSIVLFSIHGKAEEWQFLDCHFVNMLVDGAPVRLSEAEHHGHVGSGYVLEFISFSTSPSQLVRMAMGKEVRGRLCNVDFTLSDEDRAALREFASRMKPESRVAR
jgi:hypothetical protein